MRKLSTILLAVALVIGLSQCKKEQPIPQSEGNVVTITLNVGDNNGSRVNVDPTGENQVTFTDGDQILVASDGKYVGSLTKDGGTFSGTVSADDLVEGQPLYFYFLGNKQGALAAGATSCTVNISDQTTEAGLPVISMGRSIDSEGRIVEYVSGMKSFSSRLYNKCSLQKFNVTTSSTNDICITGMNNKVTVDFGKPNETGDGLGNLTNNGFSYSKDTDDNGLIKMKGQEGDGDKTYWVIVLPQAALTETGEAYSVDNSYTGTRPTIHAIESNKWYHEGDDVISMMLTAAAPVHEYVDLGLPSGLLWATCNVGANAPEEYGDYFAWGETQPKDTYNWSTYQYCHGSDNTLTKYCNDSNYGYNGFTDNLTTLLPEDDAATANWRSGWRMPTETEWLELYQNTTNIWTTQNGVNGRLFTASNGNSLFLPAAGYLDEDSLKDVGSWSYHWSSSLNMKYSVNARGFHFSSNYSNTGSAARYYGRPVRAVRSGSQN